MRHYTRRLLTGPLLVLAVGAAPLVAPASAQAAGIAATVDVNSTLKVRATPSLAAKIIGSVRDNQQVTVECSTTGTGVRGKVRTTNVWDKLSTGGYISHAYVRAGKTAPKCSATASKVQAVAVRTKKSTAKVTYKVGTVRSTDGKVNIRTAPSTTAPVKRVVLTGAKVQGVCGVVGTLVNGTVRSTTQWNRLSDGTYISHAYVVTPTLRLCPGASLTPVTTPTITPEQFLKSAVPGAQRGWREYGVPASVTMAQAILESGWGRSSLSTVDKNYFGIKCQNGRYGTIANGCHVYNTQECTKAGTCFSTSDAFRTYSSMTNSFRDHGNFLKVNSRYKPAFAYTRDANKFIWNVWKAGYATDPNYYTKVTTLMAQYKLYQYDTWK